MIWPCSYTWYIFENLYSILDRHLPLEKLSHTDFQYIILKHINMSDGNVKQFQFYTVASDDNMDVCFSGT